MAMQVCHLPISTLYEHEHADMRGELISTKREFQWITSFPFWIKWTKVAEMLGTLCRQMDSDNLMWATGKYDSFFWRSSCCVRLRNVPIFSWCLFSKYLFVFDDFFAQNFDVDDDVCIGNGRGMNNTRTLS